MSLIGQCHCGALKFEVSAAPDSVTECNCSYCSKVGALWAYYKAGEVSVTAGEIDAIYKPRMNAHHFCSTCGCTVYTVSPTWDLATKQPDFSHMQWSVNARLLENVDLAAIPHRSIDGRNAW